MSSLLIAYRSPSDSQIIWLSPMLYPKTLQRFISLHSMEVKEVDSDWNEENQLVCSCQNKMADRRTVYQKTSGSTTFDPKPTTRHVYRVPDLFGQVHQERSIKALFWCLEPLLLHQPPNLIFPEKDEHKPHAVVK